MRILKVLFAGAVSALLVGLLPACQQEEMSQVVAKGQGSIRLDLSTSAGFETMTKAVNENNYTNLNNYTVEISKPNVSTPILSTSYNNVPETVPLENGAYVVSAYYGTDFTGASRSGFRSEGSYNLTMQGEQNLPVSITCKPTCAKVEVEFDPSMADYFSDYKVVYETKALKGSTTATWVKNDTDPWYLKVNENGETVKAKIQLTAKDSYRVDNTTVEKTCQMSPNSYWKLTITPLPAGGGSTSTDGKLGLTIQIDGTTHDHDINIDIPASNS